MCIAMDGSFIIQRWRKILYHLGIRSNAETIIMVTTGRHLIKMRSIIKLTIFALIAAIAFSSAGCGDTKTANSNAAGNGAAKKDASNFPPMPAAITNTEIEFMDGTKGKIGDRKGKVLMLNLWATWCGPCRAEMPHLVELQDKYGDKGFEVVGLNIGEHDGEPEPTDRINRFTEQMKLNYPIARMDGREARHFYAFTGQSAVPTTMLVDAEGRIRGVFVGGGQNVFDKMKSWVSELMTN
jgi:thiol-disulfide isomerase/thioredoxin